MINQNNFKSVFYVKFCPMCGKEQYFEIIKEDLKGCVIRCSFCGYFRAKPIKRKELEQIRGERS